MQPKVSVIIPVYNVEKFIRKCLDSVVNQTLADIQLILVNDGSKDASGEICKEYAEKHTNILYYEQENAGSAAARNAGLNHATGEYVGFVDSDDWVEANMFERLYVTAKANQDTDIVFCRVVEDECPGAMEYIFPREGFYDAEQIKKEIIPFMFPTVMPAGNFRSIRWSNVIRLYKRSLIENNHIRSCEGVSNCEDLGFLSECTLHASSYYYLPECLYHNVVNVSSQSRNYVVNMWPRTKKLIEDMHRYIDPRNDEKLSKAFDVCIFYFCTMNLRNEVRAKDKKQQRRMVSMMLEDPECRRIKHTVTPEGMNREYQALFQAIASGSATKALAAAKGSAFKKNVLYPMVEKLLKNKTVRKVYVRIRNR